MFILILIENVMILVELAYMKEIQLGIYVQTVPKIHSEITNITSHGEKIINVFLNLKDQKDHI